ncbi:MAG TPA: TetR/AcrR family transcriptional regulator [Micromonosporaceae bacterium]|nr:TetR/AcrR family transcriptional regulator [Micromonosporaceae bacterium]
MLDNTTPAVEAAPVDQEKRAPGRPRSARADGDIIEAVLAMLAEGTAVAELSIEAVAARAGVGKATIYRRWASKDALIVDAVAALKGPIPQVEGESVREDLLTLLRSIGRVEDSRAGRILGCLMPQVHRSESLHRLYQEILEPRREVGRAVLRRGVARGELRADLDVELTLSVLTAPLILQGMARSNPHLDLDELPERILDTVFAGIVARPAADAALPPGG